jgi:hypothetical protein
MTVRLNHTIVAARDENGSATFLSQILGLPPPVRLGHFAAVRVGDTSLDFSKTDGEIHAQHDGRGVYFEDPNGHLLEILTRPYGSGGTAADKPHPLLAPTIDPADHGSAVPACSSRRNLHDHHIVFRSRGGDNGRDNRVAVCAWHHLRGLHGGSVRATGRAPDEIRWQLGARAGGPPLLESFGV